MRRPLPGRDVWLPALALVLPALAWLALEGRAYPPFEPFMTGDYAKIELYTRLAAEGSQRLGTESRFHIHHLGPAFFYFAVPVYLLLGETTRGMAVAALAWNVVFLVALLGGASRLAPRSGPFVAALLLFVFLEARGVGWLLSSWNPHLAMLPFGVALLAAARLATGEGRALPVLVLAGSVVLQGHMVWAPPLALAGGVGLLLCVWPVARRALGIPTYRDQAAEVRDGTQADAAPAEDHRLDGARLSRGAILAAIGVAVLLWALPVHDELTGSYKNFRRILTMGTESYPSRPWSDSLGPCLRALELRRDGQAPGASFEWGARNVVDPRLGTDADPIAGGAAFGIREVLRAATVAAALAAAYVLAVRRRAPTAALALVALLAAATLPVVALRSPGRELPWYLLQWGAMVTFTALLAAGLRAPGARPAPGPARERPGRSRRARRAAGAAARERRAQPGRRRRVYAQPSGARGRAADRGGQGAGGPGRGSPPLPAACGAARGSGARRRPDPRARQGAHPVLGGAFRLVPDRRPLHPARQRVGRAPGRQPGGPAGGRAARRQGRDQRRLADEAGGRNAMTGSVVETRRRLLRYLATSPLALQLAAVLRADDAITSVKDALNVFDFEEAARRALPPAHWGYLATGVNDDRTVRANREAFDRVQIRARHLVNVSRVDTGTEVFGQPLAAPIFLCPVSSMRAFHAEGELAVARAAKAERTVVGLSTMATTRIEDVTAARGEPVWFQLYPSNDTAVMRAIVKRAEAAGTRVLLLTVDMPLGPNRETQFRFAKGDDRPCAACHDKTFAGQVRRKPMYDGLDLAKVEDNIEPAMDWDYVKRLRDLTSMKVVLKGVVTREDAVLAVEHGVDGVYVSNHGGRSEESGRGALDSLPEVVEAVAGRIPVLVDSGFRRGTDVFKALALGATAVGIGRPYVWGLAAFGEEGAAAVIRMLKAELVMAMQTCGTPRLRDVGRDRVKVVG